jgi:secondary thiamine-phosphate synthase enzyme
MKKNYELTLKTKAKNEFLDITTLISNIIKEHEQTQGVITVFTPHTTAAITINENSDPNVLIDMKLGLSTISPLNKNYTHFEGNSDAHIKSSIIGVSETIIFRDNQLLLGVWQGIYFCEFDGPRTRTLYIHIH